MNEKNPTQNYRGDSEHENLTRSLGVANSRTLRFLNGVCFYSR